MTARKTIASPGMKASAIPKINSASDQGESEAESALKEFLGSDDKEKLVMQPKSKSMK